MDIVPVAKPWTNILVISVRLLLLVFMDAAVFPPGVLQTRLSFVILIAYLSISGRYNRLVVTAVMSFIRLVHG